MSILKFYYFIFLSFNLNNFRLNRHVNDIDLFFGGLSESPVSDGVVGTTFACLLAHQFRDLKRGDRFYYENGPSPTGFSIGILIGNIAFKIYKTFSIRTRTIERNQSD